MTRMMLAAALATVGLGAPALAQNVGSIVAWGLYCPLHGPPPHDTDFVGVAGDIDNALALKADHSIVAWGTSVFGLPNVPPPNTDFVAVAAASLINLGLKADGSIVQWGYLSLPDPPAPNSGFTAIAARGTYVLNTGNFNHALGLRANGSIEVWSTSWQPFFPPSLPPPAPNTGFVAIAAGGSVGPGLFGPPYRHALGLRADGSVVAWGDNAFGQCDVPPPNTGFVAVAAGDRHSLGLRADGSVVAWGDNSSGQCNVPAPNTGFVAVAGGDGHTLGLKADGSIVAWGASAYGHLNVPAPNAGYFAIATSPRCSYALIACYPDCNADGSLTVTDFSCFQGRFVLGDPYADCKTDGKLTVADFGCFQTKFVLGCP